MELLPVEGKKKREEKKERDKEEETGASVRRRRRVASWPPAARRRREGGRRSARVEGERRSRTLDDGREEGRHGRKRTAWLREEEGNHVSRLSTADRRRRPPPRQSCYHRIVSFSFFEFVCCVGHGCTATWNRRGLVFFCFPLFHIMLLDLCRFDWDPKLDEVDIAAVPQTHLSRCFRIVKNIEELKQSVEEKASVVKKAKDEGEWMSSQGVRKSMGNTRSMTKMHMDAMVRSAQHNHSYSCMSWNALNWRKTRVRQLRKIWHQHATCFSFAFPW